MSTFSRDFETLCIHGNLLIVSHKDTKSQSLFQIKIQLYSLIFKLLTAKIEHSNPTENLLLPGAAFRIMIPSEEKSRDGVIFKLMQRIGYVWGKSIWLHLNAFAHHSSFTK